MKLKQIRPNIRFQITSTGEIFKFRRMTTAKTEGTIQHIETKQEYPYLIRIEPVNTVMEVKATVDVIGFKETLKIDVPLIELIKL